MRAPAAFGDGAVVVEVAGTPQAHALADAVDALAAATPELGRAVEDVVVGSRSVTVVTDPTALEPGALADALGHLAPGPARLREAGVVEVPVVLDGPDLEEVAALAGLSAGAVAEVLARAELVVAFLGFLPGFAYLEGLPASLAGVPRRATPRPRVAAGSVALGGGFAGIYPQASPGGWHLVGRSGFRLFDPGRPPFATLRPGDRVRLRPLAPGTGHGAGGEGTPATVPLRPSLRPPPGTPVSLVVEEPGLLSTVQDLGRTGVARLGVPRAGAADAPALRAANRLLGNAEGAAGIEATALGPTVRVEAGTYLTVVGAPRATLDGRPVVPDTVVPVQPGQVLAVGPTAPGLRAYLAVAGGVVLVPVLGSASSDVLTGLGPGALRPGDRLGAGLPGRMRGTLTRSGPLAHPAPGAVRRVRVMAGPDAFSERARAALVDSTWEVGTDSDRVGLRLVGGPPVTPPVPGIASRAVVTGAIQVPADGSPVALLCDHATVGGYPVVATAVTADLGLLGACRTGDRLRFELVDEAEAHRARRALERALEGAVAGWYPVHTA